MTWGVITMRDVEEELQYLELAAHVTAVKYKM
jgi:hypothetical protein